MSVRTGYIHGTGAAINVSVGFIPDVVILTNVTDGDSITLAVLDKVIVFTSGGTTELKAGDKLTGATSGATAIVREIILDSGSWAGGDAAGWFICDHEGVSGTIVSENANQTGSGTASNIVTIVVDVEFGVESTTAVAAVTGNSGLLGYEGDATNNYALGFTLGSTRSENAKLIHYIALSNSEGMATLPLVAGNSQAAAVW